MITNVLSRIDSCVIYFRNKFILLLFMRSQQIVQFWVMYKCVGAMCAKCFRQIFQLAIKYVSASPILLYAACRWQKRAAH